MGGLKPDTFYFIVRLNPRWGGGMDDVVVCQTREEWQSFEEDETWMKERGYGFKILGNIDSYSYASEFPANEYEFVEIKKPTLQIETRTGRAFVE